MLKSVLATQLRITLTNLNHQKSTALKMKKMN